MNSIRFSTEANLDIEEILDYIFQLNPVAAHRFLNRFDEILEMLAEHPLIGRLRPEFGKDLRSYPVGNYLIFYESASNGIDIFRVVYGGRELAGIFKR